MSSPVSDILRLSATDYIELFALSNADANTVDISGASSSTFLAVQFLAG